MPNNTHVWSFSLFKYLVHHWYQKSVYGSNLWTNYDVHIENLSIWYRKTQQKPTGDISCVTGHDIRLLLSFIISIDIVSNICLWKWTKDLCISGTINKIRP